MSVMIDQMMTQDGQLPLSAFGMMHSLPQALTYMQDAHATTKASRVGLGAALQDVKANLRVAQRTKKKQGWEAMLALLTQLREASHLHDKLK